MNVEQLRKFKRLFEYINSTGNNNAYVKQLGFLNSKMNRTRLNTNKEYRNMYNSILALRPEMPGVHIHIFWGFGCTKNSSVCSYIRQRVNGIFKIQEIEHCNPSAGKAFKHIALQCATPFGPRLTQYLERKKQIIIKSLTDPTVKKVYIAGHSYGGLVVNMLCKALKHHPEVRKKLYAITFGTIYRAKPVTLSGMRIKQYMYPNDVALRCQRIKLPSRNAFNGKNNINNVSQGIIWLPLKSNTLYKKPSRAVLWGTQTEWAIHNDYPIVPLIAKYVNETVQS